MMRRVAPLLVLVGLLAGCGRAEPVVPSGPPPLAKFSSVEQLNAAVTTRENADKTAKMTISGGVDGQPDQEFYGVGVLRLDQGGASMQFAEQVQRPGAAPAEVTLVVQPSAVYLKPPADAVLPPRKSWVQLGRYTSDPFYRRFLPMAAALRISDPQTFFARYGDAVTITNSAEEAIDGARGVRYDLHADVAKAAANQPNPAIGQALRDSLAAGLTSVDLTIWLDESHRPLRTLIDQPMPGATGRFKLDSHYNTWGKTIYIGPPEPTLVTQQ
ncbi:MAG: hypothetical protein QOC83_5495 [Pseudonocardiales bacterium]|jgi:hypothetical protein|nr:hypothetical protein [Pseudonocardiales bacterium]MDT7582624.1 hypothetical protein [Pseudonocardiales bacterium]MDT7641207.1 hypothetical protein [Pseudonocardiales bacterium]MDT7676330.1 hypothetical protein [Pseudonocardiales bacterium]MDT7695683.1 hypothetical protein [Pseudonocardiales bacterium]